MERLVKSVFTALLKSVFGAIVVCLVAAVPCYFYLVKPTELLRDRATSLGEVKDGNVGQLIQTLCLQQSVCKSYRKTLNDCALAAHIDECVRIKNPNNTFGKYVCDENGESVLTKQYRDAMEVCYVEDFFREIKESSEKKLQN
jgi:hypothetical protein